MELNQDHHIAKIAVADPYYDAEAQVLVVPIWFRLDNDLEYGIGLPIDNAMHFIASIMQKCALYFEKANKENIDA